MGDGTHYTPNPTPSSTPSRPWETAASPIPSPYQPQGGTAQDGQKIYWVTYTPSDSGVDGDHHWPIVVILHIGGYHGGSYYDDFNGAIQDLLAADFKAEVADPLAPPRNIEGQHPQDTDPASGRPPQQTNAVEAVTRAAAHDPQCYLGLVGILGGSAGASHASFAALDVRDDKGTWPDWSQSQRPKCVDLLSGQYDYADRDSDISSAPRFIPDIENYTASITPIDQWNASPVSLVPPLVSSGASFIPMYFFRSDEDSGSPKSSSYYLWNILKQNGFNTSLYRMWDVPPTDNSDHAFSMWNDLAYDDGPYSLSHFPTTTVGSRAVAFFRSYLHN